MARIGDDWNAIDIPKLGEKPSADEMAHQQAAATAKGLVWKTILRECKSLEHMKRARRGQQIGRAAIVSDYSSVIEGNSIQMPGLAKANHSGYRRSKTTGATGREIKSSRSWSLSLKGGWRSRIETVAQRKWLSQDKRTNRSWQALRSAG